MYPIPPWNRQGMTAAIPCHTQLTPLHTRRALDLKEHHMKALTSTQTLYSYLSHLKTFDHS